MNLKTNPIAGLLDDTTLALNVVRGTALLPCLASVATSYSIPAFVNVRLEGEFPHLSDFYLEQISEVFRLQGSEISFTRSTSKGVRHARDWQMERCSTEYIWLLDEDVVVDSACLASLRLSINAELAAVCASKVDVNNRRGYKGYSSDIQSSDQYKGTGFRYSGGGNVRIPFLDTGNCLLHVPTVSRFKFSVFPDSTNCGGEDTLYSLLLRSDGIDIWHCLSALSWHLEKPLNNCFSEFEARRESLLRACDVLRINKSLLEGFLK